MLKAGDRVAGCLCKNNRLRMPESMFLLSYCSPFGAGHNGRERQRTFPFGLCTLSIVLLAWMRK